MTAATNSRPAGPGRRPDVVAHGPEDLLSLVPYTLGYWPRESLALLAARGADLGLTARLDLPRGEQDLEAWTRSLDGVLDQMRRAADPDRIYCVVYTDRTSTLEILARESEDGLPEGVAATDFACEHLVFRAATAAVGRISAAGLDPRDVWVVDESRDHWGPLVDPREAEEHGDFAFVQVPLPLPGAPHWLVLRGGTCEQLRTTPAAASMVCQGRAVRPAAEARADHEIMPGPFDLDGVLGASRASSLRRGVRRRLRARSEEFLDHARRECLAAPATVQVPADLDALERLLTAVVATVEEHAEGPGDLRPWREQRARLVRALDQQDLALAAHGLSLMSVVTPVLLAAGWGTEAARCWLRQLEEATEGEGPAPEVRRVLGESEEAPDSQRLRALRLVMTVLEQCGEPETAVAASAANALIGWYMSLNGQVEHYLRRAAQGPSVPAADLARGATGRRIVPAWATSSWADREYGVAAQPAEGPAAGIGSHDGE